MVQMFKEGMLHFSHGNQRLVNRPSLQDARPFARVGDSFVGGLALVGMSARLF